jgi:hypothetical protein
MHRLLKSLYTRRVSADYRSAIFSDGTWHSTHTIEVTVVVPKKAIYRLTRNMTSFNTSHEPSHHHTDTNSNLGRDHSVGFMYVYMT